MKIHCFQHVAFENPGTILEWSKNNQHFFSYTNYFEDNFSLPQIDEIDALTIMGGSMNVDEYDKFPWLKAEKQFIKRAIDAGKKVIGICLGSQLIASALGDRVYAANETEIGFFPVNFTDKALENSLFSHFKNPYNVFHWHGDTFDLPTNAELIASSKSCKNQAFLIDENVLGLQFHFEMNESVIEDMLLHDGHELEEKGEFIQQADEIRRQFQHLKQNKKDLFLLLDKFFNV
jgi:GMP synthase-like glutamine amidotransferase